MSDNKIWFSKNINKTDILKALNTLLALEFTGAIIALKFVNFFKICKDLGVEIDDKNDRNQDAAKDACADKLVEGQIGFTCEINETFSDFSCKIFQNGGVSVTGKHESYPGGYFEWSGFHSFVAIKNENKTVGYCKLGMINVKENQVVWKETVAKKKQKVLPGLPGSDKNPDRYVKISEQGFEIFVDRNWSKGKVFLDRKAYVALLKKKESKANLFDVDNENDE